MLEQITYSIFLRKYFFLFFGALNHDPLWSKNIAIDASIVPWSLRNPTFGESFFFIQAMVLEISSADYAKYITQSFRSK